MGSDTTKNVPTEPHHREDAVRLTGSNSPGTKRWVETGDFSLVGVHPNTKYYRAVRHARSLTDLEATIHARYAGLVEAAKMRRDELEEERCELWTDAEAKMIEELEKLNDAK